MSIISKLRDVAPKGQEALNKAWSDEARAAAAEARGGKGGEHVEIGTKLRASLNAQDDVSKVKVRTSAGDEGTVNFKVSFYDGKVADTVRSEGKLTRVGNKWRADYKNGDVAFDKNPSNLMTHHMGNV